MSRIKSNQRDPGTDNIVDNNCQHLLQLLNCCGIGSTNKLIFSLRHCWFTIGMAFESTRCGLIGSEENGQEEEDGQKNWIGAGGDASPLDG